MKTSPSVRSKRFKWIAVILLVLLGGLVTVFLVTQNATPDANKATTTTITTSDSFRANYNLAPEDHIFTEINASRATQILTSGTGVIMLGFPQCPWCQTLVPHLDASAKEAAVNEILYFDIREDRTDNSETYQQIVDILEPYLDKDENNEPRIYVPHIVIVKNGDVVGEYKIPLPDDGTQPTPETYWTKEAVERARTQLREEISKLQS